MTWQQPEVFHTISGSSRSPPDDQHSDPSADIPCERNHYCRWDKSKAPRRKCGRCQEQVNKFLLKCASCGFKVCGKCQKKLVPRHSQDGAKDRKLRALGLL
ncbi:hypothetical protein BU24DRAFT_250099 [Aaosphaeria arxii CBS 175.79]|uniref:Uncharacterized protein n=1 Tax=Aaosphaeria arxii CBS 175.79 TaxID=1450172 RepID=A0A6A5XLD0_9PLEO|nr:uncharacterized protein BU24DRAFT_250099 [Aaosphaeria arxii CBS 175.79]KAF2013952.1 hypothetical protein BU24DRAFT_250099 [Aaosphaeria arxii CBS 175.79]